MRWLPFNTRAGRALCAGERSLARDALLTAFGTDHDFDYDAVRIIAGRYHPLQRQNYVVAPNGCIYAPNDPGDYTRHDNPRLQGLFVHEITHAWQHQQGINVICRGALVQAAYFLSLKRWNPYLIPKDTPFSQMNLEAQAEWVRGQMFPEQVTVRS